MKKRTATEERRSGIIRIVGGLIADGPGIAIGLAIGAGFGIAVDAMVTRRA